MISSRPEPEWDDESRAEMLALAEYEAGVCDCGLHESVATDPSNFFTFKHRVCPVCAAGARWGRKVREDDEAAMPPKGSPADAPQPDDGRTAYLQPLTPEQVAAARKSA